MPYHLSQQGSPHFFIAEDLLAKSISLQYWENWNNTGKKPSLPFFPFLLKYFLLKYNWCAIHISYRWFTVSKDFIPFIVIVKYWLCLNLREPCWQWLLLSAGSLLRTNRPPHLLNPFESTPIFGFSTQEPTGTVSQTETLLLHPAQINCSWTIDARHFLHLSSSPWMPTPLYPVCLLEMCLQWVCLWHSLAHSPLCSYHFQVTDGIQSRKPKPL